ncbi:MAG: DUF1905 domain-containing protein [Candidatus Eremiobacteraeota bacterium]|nr:DUF1905 domain-containing protein [Candidatus Eremiobacteraeota bacterium]
MIAAGGDVQRFTTQLVRGDAPGSTTFVHIPREVMQAFAPRKRVPVTATIAGHAWRTTIACYGEVHVIPVRGEIRELIGAGEGDTVVVELRRDDAPRSVTVPVDLQRALEAAGATAQFDAFAFSHQNEFVRWIEEAKRPKTRRTRIDKTIERTKLKAPLK